MPSTSSVGAHTDRAGLDYWDHAWETEKFPDDVDPSSDRVGAHRNQLFHAAFRTLLAETPSPSLIELGCARSAWLPYFAIHHHAAVSGLDYSRRGAEQAVVRLRRNGIAGDIRCADLFNPPDDWRETFDVVVWFGVAEHFDDPTKAIRAAAEFLKPGGLLITEIPNLAGVSGWVQRLFNKPVYDIHVPHSRQSLTHHHVAAGLEVVYSQYVVPIDFGVVEIGGAPQTALLPIKRKILRGLRLLTAAIWWIDRRIPLPATRLFGGFSIVAARKPTSTALPT
jgi:SAM-dependent methyltransferase